jgi:ParB-like chromosome segregation protein Spo0J
MACSNGEMLFHEAANIFPLDDDNIISLADDIRENGQQVAIELLDGKVLDGRRRWLACKMAGKKPLTKTVEVADPIAYVLSLNLHRRHLSPTQLSMVGARARDLYDAQAKERQKRKPAGVVPANLPEQRADARDAVGAAVGVSGKSIDAATTVLNRGTQKLVAAVDADKLAVSTAARAVSFTPAEQDALAERAIANSGKRRPRSEDIDEEEAQAKQNGERRGVGIIKANEAINILSRIPKNDALRKRGFQLVTDWIRKNR